MKNTSVCLLVAAAMALSACGTTRSDRETSGALIGAGAGAAIGAVVAGQPWAGAAVGGVVGGIAGSAVGAATPPEDVNLGRPVWR